MAVHVDEVVSEDAKKKRILALRMVLGRAQGLVCIAFLTKTKKFHEQFFSWPEQEQLVHSAIEEKILDHNIYFCPQLFTEKKRTKQTVQWTPSAWADLDFCNPDRMFVEPSLTLESSPGRYQAFWVMERENDPDVMEDLSRRIAYKHASQGADRSGWDLTQLLRVPYTFNFKYMKVESEVPVVKVIGMNRNRYRIDDFAEDYPASPDYLSVDDIPVPAITAIAEDLLQERRNVINPLIWTLYAETPAMEANWSDILWRLLMLLFEAGYPREEVYAIATEAKCNKYARDGRPAQQLWKDVLRAEGKAELHQKLLIPVPEEFEPLLSSHEQEQVGKLEPTFVERYIKWASALGDAAPQYHQAGAFIALSSLLAGSVRLPTSFGVIIPNIWFMILADTTLTRKTTSMDIAMDLLTEIDEDVVMATDGSIEGLLTSLSIRPNRPSIFLRDEFSGLLEQMSKKDYMAGMPELLTKLYDGKMQKRILRKETIEVRDPRLIVFAGGIKNKVTGLLNFEMVSSGFMPRFIFITAESDIARVRPIGPPTIKTTGERDEIVSELSAISGFYNRSQTMVVEKLKTTIERKVITDAELTTDAWIRYNKLENDLLTRGLKHDRPEIMTPVCDRLAKSILKAAVLLSAARQRSNNLIIQVEDLLRAIKFGEQWYSHGITVLENVGKGDIERRLDLILNAIARQPQGASRSQIMQSYHLTARDASSIFETLEQRGGITRRRAGRTETLHANTELIKKRGK